MRLGTAGGIQVRMNWSATIIFALTAVGLATWQFPAVNPHQAPLAYALADGLTTLLFLASLLAHSSRAPSARSNATPASCAC